MMTFKKMDTKTFAYNQFIDTGLNRYDVFVRCLAIDDYLGKNDYGFKLYDKMQKLRMGVHDSGYADRFRKLIANIIEQGYDPKYPIKMGNGVLADGSHRTSCVLNMDLPTIPLTDDGTAKISYNKSWFDSRFTKKEIELIETKRIEIFDRYSFFSTIMLWNSMEPYFDDIENDIAKSHRILESRDVLINPDFIRKIYSCDDIAPWKVEKKIENMKGRGNHIRLLRLDMPNPKWRYKAATGNPLSTVGEKLKNKYRAQYKPFVPDYFHDVIIHTSDNFDQACFIRNTINEMYPQS